MDSAGNGRRCRIRAVAAAVGAFGGLFVTVGFVISGSVPNLFGADGTSVLIGSWVQLLGVLTAFGAGVIATSANYRHRSVDTEEVRSNIT
jgi:protein-S-isoprenylcysteine O-methyltransferase Ste14